VRFTDVSPTPPAAPVPRPEASLRGIPTALADQLREAARSARASRLAELADSIAEHSSEAANAVRSLASDFRYSELLRALDKRAEHEP
jgi:hypothetical protein